MPLVSPGQTRHCYLPRCSSSLHLCAHGISEAPRQCPTAHKVLHRLTLRPVFWLLNVIRHLQNPLPLFPPQAQRRCLAGRFRKTECSPGVAHATYCFRGSLYLPVSTAPAGSALTSGPPPGRAAPRSRLLGCPGAAPAHRHPQDHPAGCCLRRDPRRPGAALSRAPLPVRTPGPSLSAPSGAPRQAPPTVPSAGRTVPSSSWALGHKPLVSPPVPHRHLQTFYRSWQLRLALK
ncbi:hypothetical protein NDU88_007296 [Pleurodeles waltl]|uniref:Uncharacterized protein n=1 Tax=Pleurodeles waltl TaxID=8319 RepID=A0AAV7N5I0_PLEWA|nr:hypothetical protein NDU88_007296 [Pleurodeles waltl]